MISIQCRRILTGVWAVLLVRVVPAIAQAPVTAFVDVAVIPMDRERVLLHQTVVVQGDRIVALGPVKQVSVPSEAVRVNGRGKFLMPGLADMHVHFYDGNGHLETDRVLPRRGALARAGQRCERQHRIPGHVATHYRILGK